MANRDKQTPTSCDADMFHLIDVHRSARFECGSHDEGASGDGARVGAQARVQVVSLSFSAVYVRFAVFGRVEMCARFLARAHCFSSVHLGVSVNVITAREVLGVLYILPFCLAM